MKKQYVKWLGTALAVSMMGSLVAGCGSSKSTSTAAPSAAATAAATAAPDKLMEIKVPVYDRGVQGEPAVDNNYWTKWIQDNALKQANLKVTFVPIPRNQDVDKYNMLLAANDAPDIIMSYDYPVISGFYSRGALQEIKKETLDKYGADISKFLGPDLMKYGVIGGKQYLMPARRPMLGDFSSFIRQDWLDKVGMQVPTNYEELYNVLKAFKEKDPGGLGKNLIPMAMGNISTNTQAIPTYPWRKDGMSEEEFAMYSDLIVHPLSWGPEKDALKFFNKLYSEGLVSPDFALDKDNKKMEADVSNGKVGVWGIRVAKTPPVYDTLLKNVPTAKISVLNPWVAPGKKATGYGYYPFGMLVGINKASKNPEAVVKYLNWMCQKDNLNMLQNGYEGKNYKLENGLPVADTTYKGEERQILGTNKDYFCLVAEQRDFGDTEKNIKVQAVAQAPAQFVDLWVASYKKSLEVMNTTNFLFDKPVSSLSKNSKTLQAKFEEAAVKLIMSKPAEFDGLYEKYSKEYLSVGYQEILDEKQKLYKDQKAAK